MERLSKYPVLHSVSTGAIMNIRMAIVKMCIRDRHLVAAAPAQSAHYSRPLHLPHIALLCGDSVTPVIQMCIRDSCINDLEFSAVQHCIHTIQRI